MFDFSFRALGMTLVLLIVLNNNPFRLIGPSPLLGPSECLGNGKRVVIVHGWAGSPQLHWFPWLKSELEGNCFFVKVPYMPNSNYPAMGYWVNYINYAVGQSKEDTILVGHSLGSAAILRYLETFKDGEKVRGVILVAGFMSPTGRPEVRNFFEKPFDAEKIKRAAGKIIAFQSLDDKTVTPRYVLELQEKLDAQVVVFTDAGHFNQESGVRELPDARDAILSLAN